MYIILIGAQGSGKGTQAELLSQALGIPHVASGDLFRKAFDEKTELGIKAKAYLDRGELVPDEITVAMVFGRLQEPDCAQGVLLDGFPRTVAQAQALDKLLTLKKTDIAVVLALDVTEQELVSRLLNRGKTSGRSDDTDEAVIRKRFSVYTNETSPVADYYKKARKFKSIHGEGSVDEINAALRQAIDKAMASHKN